MWLWRISVLLLLSSQYFPVHGQYRESASDLRRRIRQGLQTTAEVNQTASQAAAIEARIQELIDILEPSTTPLPTDPPTTENAAAARNPTEPLFRSHTQALTNREPIQTNLPVEPVSARELETVLAEATQRHQPAELRVQGLDIQSLEAAIRGAGLNHQPGAVRITGTVNLIATPVGPPPRPFPHHPHPRPFQPPFQSGPGQISPQFPPQQPQYPFQQPGYSPQRPNQYNPQFLSQPARPPAYDGPQQVYDQSLDPRQNQVDTNKYGRPEKYAYQRADTGDNVYPPDGKGVLYRPPGTKPHAGQKWVWV